MARARALAGTRSAHDRCLTCSHARVRHLERGAGHCSQAVPSVIDGPDGEPITTYLTCTCTAGRYL